MNKISLKGIIIGGSIDIMLTNLLMIPLVAYVIVANDLTSLDKVSMVEKLQSILKNDGLISIVSLLLGSFASIAGGYVASKIAKRHMLLNGALSSIFCLSFGIYSIYLGTSELDLKHFFIHLSAPLLGMLGGYLYSNKVKSNEK